MFTDIHIFKYNHEVVLALEKKKNRPRAGSNCQPPD